MKRTRFGIAAAALALGGIIPVPLAGQPDPAARDARDGAATTQAADEEPPLRFTLRLDGKDVPVHLDQPFHLDVNGRAIEGRLMVAPTRRLSAAGVAFEYPRHMSFEVDREEPGVTIWTLDGNNSVVMLMELAAQVELDDLIEMFAAPHGGRDVRREPAQITLDGRALAGARLVLSMAGSQLRQDVFVLPSNQGTLALIVQDTPAGDGRTSPETADVVALLERTLRLPAGNPPPQR